MPLTPKEWHQRFKVQSQWTKSTRDYIFQRTGCSSVSRILDVGCGTGVISEELIQSQIENVFGIDLSLDNLNQAASINPEIHLNNADAHELPFKNSLFDCTFCHFLLMWVADPAKVISEMKRVTKPGGAVMALAEPDYGGRIDYPEELTKLNEWQTAALKNQGANPFMGRKVKALFHQAGLKKIEVGVIGAQWIGEVQQEELVSEWEIIQSDLMALNNNSEVARTAEEIRKIDLAAWALGERILFVPTFYAFGLMN
jgi:ubiquinone/menaquinone biosynthesis C-methylase UbiE